AGRPGALTTDPVLRGDFDASDGRSRVAHAHLARKKVVRSRTVWMEASAVNPTSYYDAAIGARGTGLGRSKGAPMADATDSPYWNPRHETMPRQQLEALQVRKLRMLLEWADANVPWHAKRLSD